jgi:hypothetical protein
MSTTLLSNEAKTLLLSLCEKNNSKQTAQHHHSHHEEKKSNYANLEDLTDGQFEMLLPFLKSPIDEIVCSKEKVRALSYNKICAVWQMFVQDWPYFPDKKVDVNDILYHLTQAIDPKFTLNFVLCFTKEQRHLLYQNETVLSN